METFITTKYNLSNRFNMKHQIEPTQPKENIFKKTLQEKEEVKQAQSNFKQDGLREWNERNRPSNNKKP